MFKNPFQVAIIFAVFSLTVKISVYTMGIQHGAMEKYIWYIYMLILLLAVFFGIRSNKLMYKGNTSLGQDFRTGARTASFYAILMAVITYFYYAKIDVDFFTIKKAELYATYPDKIANALSEKTMTIEQIKVKLKADIGNANTLFSPYIQATSTMFGLVFIGLFNSIVFALLMKKYPGFKK